jgi:SAM-dependent methyltransferase
MKLCLACKSGFQSKEWVCPFCGWKPDIKDVFFVFSREPFDVCDNSPPETFQVMNEQEQKHFWFTSRNRLLTWALCSYFPNMESFFEIGCGAGFVLAKIRSEFPNLRLYGSDASVESLNLAKERLPEVTLYQVDARRIPFRAEFDVIGAFDVLEHIEEDTKVLEQLFQAIRPGGGIVITVPQHPFLWSSADANASHKRRYTKQELVSKVRKAGFEILGTTSFVTFLFPLMLVSRVGSKKAARQFDSGAELKIGNLTNTLMETIMAVERIMIKAGWSLPFGGSLLLIARKPTDRGKSK